MGKRRIMEKIERARELFRILEGEKVVAGEIALRSFLVRERLEEIKSR